METLFFDIETNGLYHEVTKVHCIVIYSDKTKEKELYYGKKISEGVERLHKAQRLVGHNIIGYDCPVISKLFSCSFDEVELVDTLILAQLFYPDMYNEDMRKYKNMSPKLRGRHSLEAWGHRIGAYKGEYGKTTDWQTFDMDMLNYCVQDVDVTLHLYKKLMQVSHKWSNQSITLEHKFARIIQNQVQHGFRFDVDSAIDLANQLGYRASVLKAELLEAFGKIVLNKGTFTPKRDNKTRGYVAGAEMSKIDITDFNPSSRDHIALKLQQKYDWLPSEFTQDGKPKMDEQVLSKLPFTEAVMLCEYFTLQKRLGQIAEGKQAWLTNEREGRIHGNVRTLGAVTRRCTHSHPNVAQVPAVGVPFGKECRSLFIPDRGNVLVGCDASGLELRCLAHYMADQSYTEVLLNGDIHTYNQQMAGLPSRGDAKKFIYAFLYGAGDEKIGQIINGGRQAGSKLKQRFMKQVPSLAKLKHRIEERVDARGYLKSIDKGCLHVRSKHSALNTLLQSAGAIAMKQALINCDTTLHNQGLRFGLDYAFVANIHDEFQITCRQEYAEHIGTIAVKSIRKAGEDLGFKCPLDGEFKVGKSWAETH